MMIFVMRMACRGAGGFATWWFLGLLFATWPGECAGQEESKAERPRQAWAVVIGIERADDPRIPDAVGAVADARRVAAYLVERAGFPAENVLRMTDRGATEHGPAERTITDLRPTRVHLEWAFAAWLSHRVGRGDQVVWYAAGHAAARATGGSGLVAIDTPVERIETEAWSPEGALDGLAARRPGLVLGLLDTVNSEANVANAEGVPKLEDPAREEWLGRVSRWPGMTVWSGSSRRARAGEGEQADSFTDELLDVFESNPASLLAALRGLRERTGELAAEFRARGGLRPGATLVASRMRDERAGVPVPVPQRGHSDAVTALAISADGSRFLTASQDSTLRVWEAAGRMPRLLDIRGGHMIGVGAMALASDGRRLVSGDGDGVVRFHDLVDAAVIGSPGPTPHGEGVIAAGWIPGGAVTLDRGGLAMRWALEGGSARASRLSERTIVAMATAERGDVAAVATGDDAGRVLIHGAAGAVVFDLGTSASGVRSIAISVDGRYVAIGEREGRMAIWELARGEAPRVVFEDGGAGEVVLIAGLDADRVVFARGGEVDWVSGRSSKAVVKWAGAFEEPIAGLSVARDGSTIAAWTDAGEVRVWRRSGTDEPRQLAIDAAGTRTAVLADDGSVLLAGGGDGSVRRYELAGDRGREVAQVPGAGGKIRVVRAAPDGGSLAWVTAPAGDAFVWHLESERGPRRIPGRWNALAFVPGMREMLVAGRTEDGGELAVVDPVTGRKRGGTFERPLSRDGQTRMRLAWQLLAVSPDGTWVAAAPPAGQQEIVCVWPIAGGEPRVVVGHRRTITGLDFATSRDGKTHLLTASEDGTARVWDVDDLSRPVAIHTTPGGLPITAASLDSSDGMGVAVSLRVSAVESRVAWIRAGGGAGQASEIETLGSVDGRILALELSPDGRTLAAAGQSRAIGLWRRDPTGAGAWKSIRWPGLRAEDVPSEQTQSVTFCTRQGRDRVVAAGDDGLVRLAEVDGEGLSARAVGTLAVGLGLVSETGAGMPAWVAYTPEGVFDGSIRADQTLALRVGSELVPLEGSAGGFRQDGLVHAMFSGEAIRPPVYMDPLPIVLERREGDAVGVAELVLRLPPASGWTEARLYQNGTPVVIADAVGSRSEVVAKARLLPGENRFFAMAGRAGDLDSRSGELLVTGALDPLPGKVHVLALGVGQAVENQAARPQRAEDARAIATRVEALAKDSGRLGQVEILLNEHVNELELEQAFGRLRAATSGRPEDVVLVYLAAPGVVRPEPGALGGPSRFAILGAPGAGRTVEIPYYAIERDLLHLDALGRLVIVDAAGARGIGNDPGVRLVERALRKEAERSKTSYVSYAGEGPETRPAEPGHLHSPLAFGVLAALGTNGLEWPEGVEGARGADKDGNGILSTGELRGYLARVIPRLVAQGSPASNGATEIEGEVVEFPLLRIRW